MNKKANIYASIGTAIFAGLLLAILLLFGMSVSKEERLEGLMVSFGDELEGFGEQPAVAESAVEMPKILPDAENLLTQEEESVNLEAEREKEKQRKQAEEERRKKEAATQRMVAGAFSNSTSAGTTIGDAMSGNPIGKGSSGGHSWSLAGRSLVGNLQTPNYTGLQEGCVIVAIRVDGNGNVTDTKIANGTTISDFELREAAKEAARKAKFTTGQSVAMGEIIYRFILK
mgnify:FL=1